MSRSRPLLIALIVAGAAVALAAVPPAAAQDTLPPPAAPDSITASDSAAALPLVVDEVLVTGNGKTKEFVILREMTLHPGDTVTQEALDYDRERIYSLRLFNRVDVRAFPSGGGKAKIVVEVNERWFIFPFPILGIRDREWSKVYYGAGAVHNNFRGRNEKLFASAVFGYDPSLSLAYRNNFLDDGGSWFLDSRTSYTRVRNRSPEVEAVLGDYEERHYSLIANLGRRFGAHHSAWVTAGYRLVHVPRPDPLTTVSADGRDQFPLAGFGYSYDTRDLREYPSRGTMAAVTYLKYGLPGYDLDFYRFATDLRHFIPLPGGITLGGRLFTDNGSGKTIPAYSHVYFGYTERIRGHFDTVVEGENIAGATAEIHLPLVAVRYLKVDPLPEGFNVWRFGVTAAAFGDAGAAWFRNEKFSTGRLAKGYGAGIHFLLPYSGVLRIEYAWDERRVGELIIDLGAAL